MAPNQKFKHTVNSSKQKGLKKHYSVLQTDTRPNRNSVTKFPAAKEEKQLIGTSTDTY
jgi:hypothetical protein